MIVNVTVEGSLSGTPEATPSSCSTIVSGPSAASSSRMRSLNVLTFSPGSKVSVLPMTRKSSPRVAEPGATV
jgi:hypothetical protein